MHGIGPVPVYIVCHGRIFLGLHTLDHVQHVRLALRCVSDDVCAADARRDRGIWAFRLLCRIEDPAFV